MMMFQGAFSGHDGDPRLTIDKGAEQLEYLPHPAKQIFNKERALKITTPF